MSIWGSQQDNQRWHLNGVWMSKQNFDQSNFEEGNRKGKVLYGTVTVVNTVLRI